MLSLLTKEDPRVPAGESGLEGARGGGKIGGSVGGKTGGIGIACDIGIAGGIDCYARDQVILTLPPK